MYWLDLTDGRTVAVTNDQELWHDLYAAGHLVFSERELQQAAIALQGLEGEERQQALEAILLTKEVFDSAYVRRGRIQA